MTISTSKKRLDKVEDFKLPMLTEEEAATSDSSLFSIFGLSAGEFFVFYV
jgi:hypothetical protein